MPRHHPGHPGHPGWGPPSPTRTTEKPTSAVGFLNANPSGFLNEVGADQSSEPPISPRERLIKHHVKMNAMKAEVPLSPRAQLSHFAQYSHGKPAPADSPLTQATTKAIHRVGSGNADTDPRLNRLKIITAKQPGYNPLGEALRQINTTNTNREAWMDGDLERVEKGVQASWSTRSCKKATDIKGLQDPRSPRVLTATQSVREAVELLNSPAFDWPYNECYVKSRSDEQWYCLKPVQPDAKTLDEPPSTPSPPLTGVSPLCSPGSKLSLLRSSSNESLNGKSAAVGPSLLQRSVASLSSLPSTENTAFVSWVMGGQERISMLKHNLNKVRQMGAHCMVLTNGFDDDVHQALSAVGIVDNFSVICSTQPLSSGGGHIYFLCGKIKERVPLPGWQHGKGRFDKPFVINQILAGRSNPSWVQDVFGGPVDSVIYIDDHVERCGDTRVTSLKLEKEGSGLSQAYFNQIFGMIEGDSSGRFHGGNLGVVCVFDFDCTLSREHMYKAMNEPSSSWRVKWNRFLEKEYGAPPAPSKWRPPGRGEHLQERGGGRGGSPAPDPQRRSSRSPSAEQMASPRLANSPRLDHRMGRSHGGKGGKGGKGGHMHHRH